MVESGANFQSELDNHARGREKNPVTGHQIDMSKEEMVSVRK